MHLLCIRCHLDGGKVLPSKGRVGVKLGDSNHAVLPVNVKQMLLMHGLMME